MVIAEFPLVDKGENIEWVVLYAPLYGDRALRTRTKSNWFEMVYHGGGYVGQRFSFSQGIHIEYIINLNAQRKDADS